MRLGKSLLGSIFNKKKQKPSPLKTVGAVVATAFIIKTLFDKSGGGKGFDLFEPDEPEKKLNYEPPKPSGKTVEVARVNVVREDEDYINTTLGKLALCWYIANIDNDVTPEERVELNRLADEVRRDDKIPQRYKNSITDIFAPGIKFNTVTNYLDHADPVVLIDLVSEADRIAAINGVSDREKYAVGAFKHFVEQKTGHKFDADKVRHIDLICSSCGAVMTVNEKTSKAVCDYCGTVKVIFPD